MKGFKAVGWVWGNWGRLPALVLAVCLATGTLGGDTALAQRGSDEGRPSTSGHVTELADYLDEVQIAEPVMYRSLAVYPVLLRDPPELRSDWLTLDEALDRDDLQVREKSGGSVSEVVAENLSTKRHIFIMAGEVISGGKQTRTVRDDVVLAPGQRVELDVYCVEQRRWEGEAAFGGGGGLLPQSIQQQLRMGASQDRIWEEVDRNNAGLGGRGFGGGPNPTQSLERALNTAPVLEELRTVRRSITPRVPDGTLGFIFVDRGRALGAEFFSDEDMARELLPKLLDSYAVDHILLRKDAPGEVGERRRDEVAIEFFRRVCRAGSRRTDTPGSGAGIRTRQDRLLGDGVSLSGVVVHYGVQIEDRIVPLPVDGPVIIYEQTPRW